MYQKSQPSAPPQIGEDNIRVRLNRINDTTASIHGHIDGLIEGMFGPKPQEVEPSAPQGSSYVGIFDNIDYRLRKIDEALQFLSARL